MTYCTCRAQYLALARDRADKDIVKQLYVEKDLFNNLTSLDIKNIFYFTSIHTCLHCSILNTMAKNPSDDNMELFSSVEIEEDGKKVGLTYHDENTAVDAVLNWGAKVLCPLAKSRREKGSDESEETKRGRRYLNCPYGRKRCTKTTGKRKSRNVKLTKCPVSILIQENWDKTWTITKVIRNNLAML